jgi:hypothetical protein
MAQEGLGPQLEGHLVRGLGCEVHSEVLSMGHAVCSAFGGGRGMLMEGRGPQLVGHLVRGCGCVKFTVS